MGLLARPAPEGSAEGALSHGAGVVVVEGETRVELRAERPHCAGRVLLGEGFARWRRCVGPPCSAEARHSLELAPLPLAHRSSVEDMAELVQQDGSLLGVGIRPPRQADSASVAAGPEDGATVAGDGDAAPWQRDSPRGICNPDPMMRRNVSLECQGRSRVGKQKRGQRNEKKASHSCQG
jgi:hypothetical protein